MNNYYGNQRWETATVDGKRISLATSTVNVFLQRVLIYMGVGMAITGIIAYFLGQELLADFLVYKESGGTFLPDGLLKTLLPYQWPIVLGPAIYILVVQFGYRRLSLPVATFLLALYSVMLGVSFSFLFVIYTGSSIAMTFFSTAAMFGVIAVASMTMKLDLTKYTSYIYMAFIGFLIAWVIHFITGSSETTHLIISGIGVIVVSALAAVYIQQIVRESGLHTDDNNEAKKAALLGALVLYISFVNLFILLLQFMGASRE